MAGGIDSLLNISRRSLDAQSQALQVIGNNVANVNTDGYSRRRIVLGSASTESSGTAANLGTGVDVEAVERVVDSFLNNESLTTTNEKARASICEELLGRAEASFSLDETDGRVGVQLTQFFSALQDLAANPSDSSLRAKVIEKGNALTQSIRTASQSIGELQREADNRVKSDVDEINSLTKQIADINSQLRGDNSTSGSSLGLMDTRDQLLQKLAQKVSIKTVTSSDNTVMVSLDSGQGLVVGSSAHELEYTTDPSFAPVTGYPPGIDGSPLGHVVVNYGTSTARADVDLTGVISAGGGELGGLLSLRGVQSDSDTTAYDAVGSLVEVGARVEALARDLLTTFNQTYRGTDEDGNPLNGTQPSSGNLNAAPNNTPDVYGLFTFDGATDSNGDGLANDLAAIDKPSYASIIQFAPQNPSDIAAAVDQDGAAGSTSFASGDASNITALLGLQTQTRTFSAGNYSESATPEQIYERAVSFIGGLSSRATTDLSTATARDDQTTALRDSASGVNLDEEFAKMIDYQKVFQGSARLVSIADKLLDNIIGLLG